MPKVQGCGICTKWTMETILCMNELNRHGHVLQQWLLSDLLRSRHTPQFCESAQFTERQFALTFQYPSLTFRYHSHNSEWCHTLFSHLPLLPAWRLLWQRRRYSYANKIAVVQSWRSDWLASIKATVYSQEPCTGESAQIEPNNQCTLVPDTLYAQPKSTPEPGLPNGTWILTANFQSTEKAKWPLSRSPRM